MQPGSAQDSIVRPQVFYHEEQYLLSYRTCLDKKGDVPDRQCGSSVETRQNPASKMEMINRNSHLLKGWEMEQIGCTAWIDENPVHIKTINTYSQYECVAVWCDDPCRVNRWKGYRVVHRKDCWDISPIADGVHSGSNRGCPEHSSPLFLGLILVVDRSPKYKVNSRPRSWSMFDFCYGPVGYGSSCCPASWLPQEPSEVAGPN